MPLNKSIVISCRKKLNLSQAELAEKAGLSIRTIQRIESGTVPKGYTLEALCQVLDISREDLLGNGDQKDINWKLVKYINLSSLVLMIIPAGNILIPLALFYWKKEINHITKQLITLQFLWTLGAMMIVIIVAIIKDWLGLKNEIMALTCVMLVLFNVYFIIRNTMSIDRRKSLHLKPGFSIL